MTKIYSISTIRKKVRELGKEINAPRHLLTVRATSDGFGMPYLDRILFFAKSILEKENKKEFSIDDIMEYFDQFGLPKPKNPPRDFKSLVSLKKGYLLAGSSENLYKLSFDGQRYIEEKLNKLEIK